MNEFVLHPDALADLEEIWEFIAADDVAAADRVLEEIHEAMGRWRISLKWATGGPISAPDPSVFRQSEIS
jgi:hypothetical protein